MADFAFDPGDSGAFAGPMISLGLIGVQVQRAARRVVVPIAASCIIVYFAAYAINGQRGLVALRLIETEITEAERVLGDVTVKRRALEERVALLRADHLDLDMLDERARLILNYSRADEMIVLEPPRHPPAPVGDTDRS